jgi:hypothetical protein
VQGRPRRPSNLDIDELPAGAAHGVPRKICGVPPAVRINFYQAESAQPLDRLGIMALF